MRSIVGLALLITGLSIGAFAYYPETVQQHVSLANVTRVIAPVASANRAAPAGQVNVPPGRRLNTTDDRSFSPGARLSATIGAADAPLNSRPGGVGASKITTAALPQHGQGSLPGTDARAVAPKRGWTTVVTPAISNRSGASGSRPLRSSLPADGSARYALIRDIQRELKRVGCYWGKIDGDWGPGSKRAIDGFVRTVNAALPTRDPDYILLALVRAQHGQVCGTSNGRAIIADARSGNGAVVATKQGTGTGASGSPRLTTRPQPAKRGAGRVVAARPVIAPRPRPAPGGRMAVGGPRPDQLDARETAPGTSSVAATHRVAPRVAPRRRAKTTRTIVAPAPRLRVNPQAKKKKKRRKVARASPKKKARRKTYRRRRRNPLRNLLLQGVH